MFLDEQRSGEKSGSAMKYEIQHKHNKEASATRKLPVSTGVRAGRHEEECAAKFWNCLAKCDSLSTVCPQDCINKEAWCRSLP